MKLWLNEVADFVGQAEIARRGKHGSKVSLQPYRGRQAIVMFRNFWGPGNQGDHIDLWDGVRMTHGDPGYFSRSQEVWFWDLSSPRLW
jgi:hypothetical protein